MSQYPQLETELVQKLLYEPPHPAPCHAIFQPFRERSNPARLELRVVWHPLGQWCAEDRQLEGKMRFPAIRLLQCHTAYSVNAPNPYAD